MGNLTPHILQFDSATAFECTRCGKKMAYIKNSGETLDVFNRRVRQFFKIHRLCKEKNDE